MVFKRLILAAAIVSLPGMALSESQYSAQDIVSHFNAPEETAAKPDCPEGAICLPKKGTRAVCIGTGSACAGESAAAPAQKSGFDLLITFELGSDRLSQQAQANLQEFARAMSDPALQNTQFNVDGHTDARGSDTFNEALSKRRAEAVVSFLKGLGIDQSRLQAKGYGESKPRSDDPMDAINRRVEATIRTR
jgi:outer membrane protein OmpA-like peptidoglycan-associated protein